MFDLENEDQVEGGEKRTYANRLEMNIFINFSSLRT